MGLGRFLGKNMIQTAGIVRQDGDREQAVVLEDDGSVHIAGPTVAENSLKVADGNVISAMFRTTYTWNMGAIAAINVGSINSIITQDVAMSGAAVGDFVVANPVASINALVGWMVACHSANNVQLKAWYTGSLALTPGNVPFKIVCIKL